MIISPYLHRGDCIYLYELRKTTSGTFVMKNIDTVRKKPPEMLCTDTKVKN